MNKAGKGAQWLFSSNSGYEGLIYPDFISRNSDYRIIADAKYKPENNIRNKDYLQVLAYMHRFGAKKGYYLYPEICSKHDQVLWLNKGLSYDRNVCARNDILLVKHGLLIPDNASNYDDFVKKINESEDLFTSELLQRELSV